MKNKILFAMFVSLVFLATNNASAYYCPSTGRWLSRDPNGELGFETLRASSAVPRVGQIASTASLPPSRLANRDPIVTKADPNRYEFVRNDASNKFDLLGLDVNLPPGGDPLDPWPYAPPPYHNPHQPVYPPSLPPGYVGGEADFFFGGGFSRIVCCDENGTKRIFWYSKICIGGAIGIGGGGGVVVSGMSGKNCRASNYEGWFYETAISRGIGGGGVDIGYEPFPGTESWPVSLPGGLSGVNEVGGGLGQGLPVTGLMVKSAWCYYMLISEKDIPCGCGK